MLTDVLMNSLANSAKIFMDIQIGKTDDRQSIGFQYSCTFLI